MTPLEKRKELVQFLRDPTRWPSDFKWNFIYACGIGLAHRLGHFDILRLSSISSNLMDVYDINYEQMMEIFIRPKDTCPNDTTPEMVASRMESLGQ